MSDAPPCLWSEQSTRSPPCSGRGGMSDVAAQPSTRARRKVTSREVGPRSQCVASGGGEHDRDSNRVDAGRAERAGGAHASAANGPSRRGTCEDRPDAGRWPRRVVGLAAGGRPAAQPAKTAVDGGVWNRKIGRSEDSRTVPSRSSELSSRCIAPWARACSSPPTKRVCALSSRSAGCASLANSCFRSSTKGCVWTAAIDSTSSSTAESSSSSRPSNGCCRSTSTGRDVSVTWRSAYWSTSTSSSSRPRCGA